MAELAVHYFYFNILSLTFISIIFYLLQLHYPIASLTILQTPIANYLYYSCSLFVTRLFQPFLYHFQLFQPKHLAVYPIAISSNLACSNLFQLFRFYLPFFANYYNFSMSLLLARQFQSFIPYF